MLEELLSKNEGKTLEFKENTLSLHKIIQTISDARKIPNI